MTIDGSDLRHDTTEARMSEDSRVIRFRWLFLTLAVVGAAMGLAGVGLTLFLRSAGADHGIPGLDLIRHLTHPSGEATLYSWFSVLLLVLLALVFGVIALTVFARRGQRWRFFVLAATAALLSADEAAMLHEKLADVAAGWGLSVSWTYNWLLVALPLAVAAGVFLLWLAKELDARLRMRLVAAGALYLLGAVGMEVVGGLIESGTVGLGFVALQFSILIEESLEIAGVLVALWAALSYLRVEVSSAGLRISTVD